MAGFWAYATRRGASAAVTLLLVSIVIFSAIHWLPGSYADVFLGAQPTPQAKARVEAQFGLNQPLPVQYLKWVANAVGGDFGVSLVTQKPVAEEFGLRLPATAQLALMATAIALVVGLPFGILGGLATGRPWMRGLFRLWGSLAMSVPDFVIGSLLLYLLASMGVGTGNWVSLGSDPGNLWAAFVPACALAALGVGFIMTTTRHATISVRGAPWVLAATARGKSNARIVSQHIVKNSAIPVVTVIAIYLGYMLGGTAIIESLFTVPGIGRYILQAISLRDYPVVQAGVLLAATIFIVLNMAVDLLYAMLDPRIRA